jgi:hypothetical protein
VESCRVEDGHWRVVRTDEEVYLRAAEEDRLGTALGHVAHDPAVLVCGMSFTTPTQSSS